MKRQTKPTIPASLEHFDSLPSSGYVRKPTVCALLACSSMTVTRRVAAGTLPAPRKLSERILAWNVGELRQFLSEKP